MERVPTDATFALRVEGELPFVLVVEGARLVGADGAKVPEVDVVKPACDERGCSRNSETTNTSEIRTALLPCKSVSGSECANGYE
jgi:hypothetical protein